MTEEKKDEVVETIIEEQSKGEFDQPLQNEKGPSSMAAADCIIIRDK